MFRHQFIKEHYVRYVHVQDLFAYIPLVTENFPISGCPQKNYSQKRK